MPLEFFAGRAAIRVGLNGKGPFAFLLSPEARMTLIDRALAAELNIEPRKTAAGTYQIDVSLELGSTKLADVPAAVTDGSVRSRVRIGNATPRRDQLVPLEESASHDRLRSMACDRRAWGVAQCEWKGCVRPQSVRRADPADVDWRSFSVLQSRSIVLGRNSATSRVRETPPADWPRAVSWRDQHAARGVPSAGGTARRECRIGWLRAWQSSGAVRRILAHGDSRWTMAGGLLAHVRPRERPRAAGTPAWDTQLEAIAQRTSRRSSRSAS